MASVKCNHCGAQISAYATECEYCGMAVKRQGTGNSTQDFVNGFIGGVNNATKKVDQAMNDDASQNKVFGVLCYLGFFWLIPFFVKRDSNYVKFHLNQGLILIICDIGTSLVSTILTKVGLNFGGYISILNIVWFVFTIMGIVHAVKEEEIELPVIGQFKILS